jgi:ABC-type nitrate/sulfonate/bicarbonate transport system ATPase subunit
MPNLLQVLSLSKSFLFEGKPVLVLKDLSLTVREHEFISIIGSSGCGKSTLLELLAGITTPDSGQILHNGSDITGKAGHCGYMPQEDLLLPWLSLTENAILPVRIKRGNIQAAKSKALKLMTEFGLAGYERYKPGQLSGGMKQRSAFLRTLMFGSDILLLDEPFANLDALTRLQMQDWLAEVQSRLQLTIILVTHDIDEAIRLADKIYVMDSSPGPFISIENVPEELHANKEGKKNPKWSELKSALTAKLLKQ